MGLKKSLKLKRKKKIFRLSAEFKAQYKAQDFFRILYSSMTPSIYMPVIKYQGL